MDKARAERVSKKHFTALLVSAGDPTASRAPEDQQGRRKRPTAAWL